MVCFQDGPWFAHRVGTQWVHLLYLMTKSEFDEGKSSEVMHKHGIESQSPGQKRCAISHSLSLTALVNTSTAERCTVCYIITELRCS